MRVSVWSTESCKWAAISARSNSRTLRSRSTVTWRMRRSHHGASSSAVATIATATTTQVRTSGDFVKGLIAITLALYSGRPAAEITATDAATTFKKLGLDDHLTPQRSNGVRAMVDRIKADARGAEAA